MHWKILFSLIVSVALGNSMGAAQPVGELTSGSWIAQPIAETGGAAPGTDATYQEFGNVQSFASGAVSFRARFGRGKNEWGLFWWDGESVRLVLRADRPVRSDSGSFKVGPGVDFAGGPHLPLIAWDGAHFYDGADIRKLVQPGDALDLAGETYLVRAMNLSHSQEHGPPILSFDAGKPHKQVLWIRATQPPTLAWIEGQTIPGLPGATLKKVIAAVDLKSASILLAELEGAPFRDAVLRWTADGAEVLFDDRRPAAGDKSRWPIRLWTADAHTLAIKTYPLRDVLLDWEEPSRLYLVRDGQVELVLHDASQLRDGSESGPVEVHGVAFAGDGSARFLASFGKLESDGRRQWTYPELGFFDGERLRTVPWEKLGGMTYAESRERLRNDARIGTGVPPFEVHPAPGRPGWFIVELRSVPTASTLAPKIDFRLSGRWLVDGARPQNGLQREPHLATDRGLVSSADVVAVRGEELIVRTSKEISILRRDSET